MKIIKRIGIALGGLIGLVLVAVIILYAIAAIKISRTYDITPESVAIPSEAESIERGRYLASISCNDCHGQDLGGTVFFDDPSLGTIPASNLTNGNGGVGSTYTDADYVRAIRHGVGSDGKPLLIMPAVAFYNMSDEDLGAVIAHIRGQPPVDKSFEEKNLTPMAHILFAIGALGDLPADVIDHDGPRPPAPEQDVTPAYGEYLANILDCRACHGESLSGGQGPEPGMPPGPNLTPGGELASWSASDFINTIRTGVTPEGEALNARYMPWPTFGKMTDDDLTAIFQYLQSLPAAESTTQ